jgi:hypothetical protein
MLCEVALGVLQIRLGLRREHATRITRRRIRVAPTTEPATAKPVRELRCMKPNILGRDALLLRVTKDFAARR